MSSSSSPCAACKFLRRKCTQECVFAPYFPPDQPTRFASVHKVFGASNVAKLLNELDPDQREDAVNSLAYEADARLKDPIYGCVGLISMLQQRLKKIQHDIYLSRKELAAYIGPTAHMPMLQGAFPNQGASTSALQPQQQHQQQFLTAMMGGIPAGLVAGPSHAVPSGSGVGGQLVIREPQQQQQQQHHFIEAQQLAALPVRDDQDLIRNWEQQQLQAQQLNLQQHAQYMRFNNGGGYDGGVMMVGGGGVGGSAGFNQAGSSSGVVSPSLALGAANFNQSEYNQIQSQQQPQQPQDESLGQLLLLQQPVTPQQQQQHDHGEVIQGIPHLLEHDHPQQPQQQQHGSVGQSQHHQLQHHFIHHHLHQQNEHNIQLQRDRSEEDRTDGPAC